MGTQPVLQTPVLQLQVQQGYKTRLHGQCPTNLKGVAPICEGRPDPFAPQPQQPADPQPEPIVVATPTLSPTAAPSPSPTAAPTQAPTHAPTHAPTRSVEIDPSGRFSEIRGTAPGKSSTPHPLQPRPPSHCKALVPRWAHVRVA